MLANNKYTEDKMEVVDAATETKEECPTIKEITKAALKSGITQENYNDYIDIRGLDARDTEEVLEK